MKNKHENQSYKITNKYELTNIGEEALLIPVNKELSHSKVLVLNQVSTQIWDLLISKEYDTNKIYDTLFQSYNVEKENLIKDINDFIDLLIDYDVIV
ncbi:MAG: PqqD family protein [Clostridium sp.]